MKNKNFILLLAGFSLLTSCSMLSNEPNKEQDNGSHFFPAGDSENDKDDKENDKEPTTPTDPVEPEDPSEPSDPLDPIDPQEPGEDENDGPKKGDFIDGKYYIDDYGDYLESTIEGEELDSIVSRYKALDKKVTGEINGPFQTSYKKGLLDLFDMSKRVDVKINITDENYKAFDNDYFKNNRETYRECDVDISFDDFTFHYVGVGMRQKGNLSIGQAIYQDTPVIRHYKLSFEETFDDDYREVKKVWDDEEAYEFRQDRKFFGLPKLDLRWNRNADSTYIREPYAFEMYRGNGALSPRANAMHVSLNIDGTNYNLGIFNGIETLNKSFIKRNFIPECQDGNLYKCAWADTNEGMSGAYLTNSDDSCFGAEEQFSNGDSFYMKKYVYDLKTNKKDTEHTAIKNFINALKDKNTESERLDFYNNYLYLDQFIAYSSVSYLLGDPDDLRGNSNNTYIYFTPNNNKAIIIPIDHDRTLGGNGVGGDATGNHQSQVGPYDSKTGYSGSSNTLFAKAFVTDRVLALREALANKIDDVISNGWMSDTQFDKYFDKVKLNYESTDFVGSKVFHDLPTDEYNYPLGFSKEEVVSYNMNIEEYFVEKTNTFNNRR